MEPLALWTLGAAALATLPRVKQRIELSRAKHRSLAGHSRLSRWVAGQLPSQAYGEDRFFRADGAPDEIEARRRAAFARLSDGLRAGHERSLALTRELSEGLSDLQFTSAYRVPFQFSPYARRHLEIGAFVEASSGTQLTDLDGNTLEDLSGAYGLNLFGYDFFKACMDRAAKRAGGLGPVLGAYHPVVADNVRRLRAISGLDEVSFHMSGTEAVMQAVRLARYHTRRSHLVRFCGAYHGWWGDVQPGIGNPVPAHDTYTLKDMHEGSLRVLRRRKDLACVLVNPLQALHPNASAPGDSSLVDGARHAHFDREAYTAWLRELREVCTARGIVLIFDEVLLGFRLAPGGAQEYFGIRADMVTYGKALGGGFPVGVVCGRAGLMKRWREDRPADVCFARGTFNSHPYVMAAMNEFLLQLDTPEVRGRYRGLDDRWNSRAARLNLRLQVAGLPVSVANLSTIWTVSYSVPSRYNWMLQYYLRSHGLHLSWVGTGRLIFTLDYSDAAFEAFCDRFVAAATAMQRDGWWWCPEGATNRSVRRGILRELLARRLGR